MRILFVTQYFCPAWGYGGPAGKVTAMSRELARRGYDVEVATTSVGETSATAPGRPGTAMVDGVTAHYFRPVLAYRGVTINPGAIAYYRRRLPSFDVVHVFGLYDWLGAWAYRYLTRSAIPYVVEPLGMYVPAVRGYLRKWIYRHLVGDRMLRDAARVIATSDAERDQLRATAPIAPDRLTLRRNGVDPIVVRAPDRGQLRRRLQLNCTDRLVVFLGRVAPIKHLELLIDAFATLEVPSAHLVVAGPEPDRAYAARVRARAAAAANGSCIHFVGPVEGPARVEVFADAEVVVLPSRTESFGNVVAEAVSASVPVVVTDGCGVANDVRDRAGLVCRPLRQDLRDALRRLLTDRALYERLTAGCAGVWPTFTWQEPMDVMERIYNGVRRP